MDYVVGIDIGGTCTDCVIIDGDGNVKLGKAFSTPPDFSSGILDSLTVGAERHGRTLEEVMSSTRLFLHSTSIAENAVVDDTLAPMGVITNAGFEDTLLITRGGYGRWSGLTEDEKRNFIETDKLEPIVPRSRIRGLRERTDAQGRQVIALDDAEVEQAVGELVANGAEAIGVCLMWSLTNGDAEQRVKQIIERLQPGMFHTISSEIAPIMGEYERTQTVALNAGLGPVVGTYLDNLRAKLHDAGFRGRLLVMQAYGGLVDVDEAAERPVAMIESGPVSGLVGSQRLGERIGFENIIAADVGGTTFKVGVVREGLIEYQREAMVLRYHYSVPKMDIVSLGLAGGSVIWIEPRTGTPRIGPNSAGSYPGPVCYDHGGTEPTITDVDAILGYLNPDFFLGGRASLNIEKARKVLEEKIAKPLGVDLLEAASSMYRLANALFYDLLHKTTVQRGLDPRQFALFSFGGTAGMHAAAYGEMLGVPDIVISHAASVQGAFGLIASDVVHEEQVTQPMRWPVDVAEVKGIYDDLAAKVPARLRSDGFDDADIVLQPTVDARYRRQVHIITVPVASGAEISEAVLEGALTRFEHLYTEKYGPESAYREAGVELVTFRVRGTGNMRKPEMRHAELGDSDASDAIVRTVEAWVDRAGELQEVPGYDFEKMAPGHAVEGPGIIWTPITTVVLAPDQLARVDEYRNLVIRTSAGRERERAGLVGAAEAGA